MSVETFVLLHIVFWNMWYFFLWFFDEYKIKKAAFVQDIIFSSNISLYYDFLFI